MPSQYVEVLTQPLSFFEKSSSPFLTHDHGIFLQNDKLQELLVSPNLTLTVSVTDMNTNGTLRADGMDAVNFGVTGLKSATKYKACVSLAQVEGTCTFDCRKKTLCYYVTTLPTLSPHWKSLTWLWTICGVLSVLFSVVLLMLIVVWMRLNALGAPSSKLAWIQLKSKEKNSSTMMEEVCPINNHQESASHQSLS